MNQDYVQTIKMSNKQMKDTVKNKPNIFSLFSAYKWSILLLIALTTTSSGLGLWLPKIIAKSIDSFSAKVFSQSELIWQYCLAMFIIYIAFFLQSIVQTYTSERVARDLRNRLTEKISLQSHAFIEKIQPSKLLTNLTADVDSIKLFVSLAISTIISSVIIIIGSSIILLTIDWQLALAVLTMVPVLGIVFFILFSNAKLLFKKSRENVDWLNGVINESILGSTIIRVLNSQEDEFKKFNTANAEAKNIGIEVLKIFASLIPLVTFIASLASLTVLALGGYFTISGNMTLGSFAAFNSYIALLIFPIIILGFMSNLIAQATASYDRINDILSSTDDQPTGLLSTELIGEISLENITLNYNDRSVLKNVSFRIPAKSRTAIIGPTAAGKTQLMHLLIGLVPPTSGNIFFDNKSLEQLNPTSFHKQVGLVFQDSVIFNLSLRENIAFNQDVKDTDLQKAIETAELNELITSLPLGLETIVSERGSSLSGGQKQRIMLARALSLNPKVLLLDDFTARVDASTELSILKNIEQNYPDITLVSVTQKISSINQYEQIILLMEGELIATGTHDSLIKTSPEYAQIFNSQKSTNEYE